MPPQLEDILCRKDAMVQRSVTTIKNATPLLAPVMKWAVAENVQDTTRWATSVRFQVLGVAPASQSSPYAAPANAAARLNAVFSVMLVLLSLCVLYCVPGPHLTSQWNCILPMPWKYAHILGTTKKTPSVRTGKGVAIGDRWRWIGWLGVALQLLNLSHVWERISSPTVRLGAWCGTLWYVNFKQRVDSSGTNRRGFPR